MSLLLSALQLTGAPTFGPMSNASTPGSSSCVSGSRSGTRNGCMPSCLPPMHIWAITTACVAELPEPPIHVLPADGSGV